MTEQIAYGPLLFAAQSGSTSIPGSGAPAPSGQPVTGAPGAAESGATPAPGGGMMTWFLPIMLALMIFTSFSSQRKEKKRRAELLASSGRSDRVQTVGGIIGTVAEIHGEEIVIKVDDATNIRIRFARSSVQQVLRSGGGSKSDAMIEDSEKDAA